MIIIRPTYHIYFNGGKELITFSLDVMCHVTPVSKSSSFPSDGPCGTSVRESSLLPFWCTLWRQCLHSHVCIVSVCIRIICSKVTLGFRRHTSMLTSTQYDTDGKFYSWWKSNFVLCKNWGYKELSGIHSVVCIRGYRWALLSLVLRVAINSPSILDLDSPIPLCL